MMGTSSNGCARQFHRTHWPRSTVWRRIAQTAWFSVRMTKLNSISTTRRMRASPPLRPIERAGAGMVMLVGVQSNQFPRALDIAAPLRARGIAVVIGGFHVSGAISMLDGVDADLDRAKAMGVSLFAGEAEGRLEDVLQDVAAGALKPLYNFMNDLPNLAGTPLPMMPAA